MSFLPVPAPYVQQPHYFQLDYMRTEDWSDTTDVRAYGDYQPRTPFVLNQRNCPELPGVSV